MCGKSLFVLLYLFFWLLITSLVSFDYCIVCPSQIYDCWLPLWCLVAIVLSVLLRFTAADYPFGVLWPLCCLSFFALRLLITPLVSCDHCVVCPSQIYGFWLPLWCLMGIVLSVLLRLYCCWLPLWCLVVIVLSVLRFTASDYPFVCPSSLYGCWLPLWYLVAIVLSVLLRVTASDYLFGILWPLCCLSFFALRLLITPLVSSNLSYMCIKQSL